VADGLPATSAVVGHLRGELRTPVENGYEGKGHEGRVHAAVT